MRRAEALRHRELALELVDRDDLQRARDLRALDRCEAYAAGAEHRDRRAGLDLRGPQHRADAGGDAASDERRAIERDVLADFHDRVLMQQHLLAVRRNVEELVDRLALLREARLVIRGALSGRLVGASVRMPRHALLAVTAEHRQARDDVVARLHVGDLLADFLDDTGGLVSEDRGRGVGIKSVDKMQVAVAHAAMRRLDENFAVLRLVDLDVLDGERLIGAMEDGGFH